uniref:YhjD/YihY/BrkB family envelope integrity protein n=1 Tax=Streptomyces lushanensis TaxID=1434255 RepID=UPI001FDEE090
MAWLLLKDTVNSCIEYRVLGLAAEAAFFTLLSLPPLLLGLIGLLGYVDDWTSTATVASIEKNILGAVGTVLSDRGVNQIAKPLLDDITKGGRPDVISLGFAIALWSGSRAVNVFVDTITVMYGLDGRRGIVATRLLAFLLFLVALLIGAVVLPLAVVGPDRVVELVPWGTAVVSVLYWPVVILLSIAFLTTLYHVSVPARSRRWMEDAPGALVALGMWVLGSFLLRIYLTSTVEGPTIYGSLAAPTRTANAETPIQSSTAIGAVVLPLAVVGPDRVVELVPWGTAVVSVLYWPVVILLSIAFLTTLYHVSVPARSRRWMEDAPGALVALGMWVLGSFLLRIYLTSTVEGPTIYG